MLFLGLNYVRLGERKLLKRTISGIMLTLLLIGVSYTTLNIRPTTSWSNGGFSTDPSNPKYGTHDWIAQHALDWLPLVERQFILDNLANYLYGTELPDNGTVPGGIGDTAKHHVYYFASGSLQDDASAVRAEAEYNNAFQFFRQGKLVNAARSAGIMSHYIVDVAVFGHVMASGTNWGEAVHHSDYEAYVNARTDNYTDEFNAYLAFDGELRIISAYDATIELAYDTTFDVNGDLTCVWMDRNYSWSNPVFKDRAGESLNLAVNYLADVLHTLYVTVSQLYVSPTMVEYWTVSYGTIFTTYVKILNVFELYAFEFKLYWNTSLLDLVGINIISPSVWGTNYFVGVNDTREDLGRYWLVVAALNPAPSFNGSTTLARLTFKITYDPIYPNNVTSSLDLADTELSDQEANPILHSAYDGKYQCLSTKPRLEAKPSTYTATTLGKKFTVNITIADIVNLYSFEFQLTYNTTVLDATEITIGPFLKSPYQITKKIIDDSTGSIWLSVKSQPPAPSSNGSGILATITFMVPLESGIWHVEYTPLECDLQPILTILKTDKGITVPHDTTNLSFHYKYMPISGDLNSDGIVNIFDLRIVAKAYGSEPGEPNWDSRADLNRDSKINIYDLVLVSKNYGRTTP
jgi:hypothetical protein